MSLPANPALDEAIRACRAMSIEEVAGKLGLERLRAASGWLSGPCPVCGGTDRFNINLRDAGFFCRKDCEAKGSGAIDLVMVVQGLEFRAAVDWLHGPVQALDPAEIARRERLRAQDRARAQAEEAHARARAIEAARGIWRQAGRAEPSAVFGYLSRRGLTEARLGALPACLRYIPDHPYRVMRMVDGRRTWPEMHRGPCMVAAVQGPDRRLICVHQTWFDLSAPDGKPVITWQGERQRNKLTRGSQVRGAIRLITPAAFDTLVMGEGIETTLTAAVAWQGALAGAAYWAGISLGHMGGKMAKAQGQRHSGVPDMEDERCFVPPPWVRRLIYLQDGDSEPVSTRAKLTAGLRRAMRLNPECRAEIVAAPVGQDLNDMLTGAGT